VSKLTLTPEVMTLVAERFRALGEPARLQILSCLRDGEQTVGDLVDATGFGQANVSKHLNILRSIGFVRRRKEGLFVYYSLADKGVLGICETMCGRLEAEMKQREKLLAG
jgi:ArsR family transcriptional regulator